MAESENEGMPRVYLETSVVSYLAAFDSRDLVVLSHRQVTREWWQRMRRKCRLYVSDLVYMEAGRGDADAAKRRHGVLDLCAILEETDAVRELAELYVRAIPLPPKMAADALHMALAAWHGIDFLLTWNCRHIANGFIRRRIDEVNRREGIVSPTICTPEELLYGHEDEALD